MILLVVTAVTALFAGETGDAMVILLIVIIHTVYGVVRISKTHKGLVSGTEMANEFAPNGGYLQAQIGLMAVGASLLIFLLGLFRGHRFYEMFLMGISLAVTMVPGGLPLLSTDLFVTKVKTFNFLLPYKLGVVMVVFSGIMLGWPLPLAPLQLLWVNLMMGILTALAPGEVPTEGENGNRPPHPPDQSLFPRKEQVLLACYGIVIALVTLAAFRWGQTESVPKGETMAFVTLGIYQLVRFSNIWSRRGTGQYRKAMPDTKFLWSMVGTASLLLIIIVTPGLRRIFRVQPLSLTDWLVISGLTLTALLLVGVISKTVVKK
jgi:magnesium-transporting ATPase (P-type)